MFSLKCVWRLGNMDDQPARLDLNAEDVNIDEAPVLDGCEGLGWSRTDWMTNASMAVAGTRRTDCLNVARRARAFTKLCSG
jgi:hypothetical protein